MAADAELPAEIKAQQSELRRICQRFHVQRLELFGSGVADRFDPSSSDLDFLVEFENLEPKAYAEMYFGLLEGLGQLFNRPIDLVVKAAVKNPYFLQRIEREKTLLYAA